MTHITTGMPVAQGNARGQGQNHDRGKKQNQGQNQNQNQNPNQGHGSWQLWMGLANVLACLAVLFLHLNSFWDGPRQGRSFLSATVIETCFDWAVPVFLMLSGANIIDYRRRMSTRTYARKRVQKTLIPFLAWSLIALVYGCLTHSKATADLSPLAVVNGILATSYCSVYWFFMPLFAIYLSVPFLSLMDQRDRAFVWLAGLAFLFYSVLPLVSNVVGLRYSSLLAPPIVGGYLIFLFLGHLVCNTDLLDKWRMPLTVLALACVLVKVTWVYLSATRTGEVNRALTKSVAPFNVILATAVLLNLKLLKLGGVQATSRLYRWTRWLTGKTFGVYLVHYYVCDILFRVLPDVVLHSIWYRTLGVLVVFLVCVALVAALQRIPGMKRILPG